VVVSHQFWQRHLGAREDALGEQIIVGQQSCTLVGVLRAGQVLPIYAYATCSAADLSRRSGAAVDAVDLPLGRPRSGLTRELAQQALDAVTLDVPPPMQPFIAHDRPVLTSMKEANQVMRTEIFWVMLAPSVFSTLSRASTPRTSCSCACSGSGASSPSASRSAAVVGAWCGCLPCRA